MSDKQDALIEVVDLITRHGLTIDEVSAALKGEPAFKAAKSGGILSRYFFTKQGGGVAEDPGTGSACANLGGWLLATSRALPAEYIIDQGEAVGRPCRLRLSVGSDGAIRVGGRVLEIGRGTVTL